MEAEGKKVYYFHAVAFSIANTLNKQRSTSDEQPAAKSVTKAGWLKIQLRKIALLIDLLRFKTLLKKLRQENYDYLLSDRYFYDSVINIAYLAKTERFFSVTIPRPDRAFYLKVDPESIMGRERPADQGLKYLQRKKILLDSFAQKNDLAVIDGNRTKEEIFNNLKSQI